MILNNYKRKKVIRSNRNHDITISQALGIRPLNLSPIFAKIAHTSVVKNR